MHGSSGQQSLLLYKLIQNFRSVHIPQIIHQTWKDDNIPDRFHAFVRSWRVHHPGWEYILWTDASSRHFIQMHFPDFLPLYDRYPTAIQKVDAARYLILYKLGGIFADLDVECMKNLVPLLGNAQFIAGKEPVEHAIQHHKDYIISNAIMAASPQSGFLHAIYNELTSGFPASIKQPNFDAVLNTTGPFMLTRAYANYPNKNEMAIHGADLLYPLVKDSATGKIDHIAANNPKVRETAYTIHYYWGSWWQS